MRFDGYRHSANHGLGKITPRQVPKAVDTQVTQPISCKSANENRPYIVADGSVSACCWVEGSEDEKHMYSRAKFNRKEHNINRRLLQEVSPTVVSNRRPGKKDAIQFASANAA